MGEMITAWVVGIYGLSTFLGMLLSGYSSDRINRERIYTLGTVCLLAGCLCLMFIRSGGGLALPILYSLFFGLGFGSMPSMDSATT